MKQASDKIILTTSDNCDTIFLAEWNETYHSKHGALEEALHVFINNGLLLHPTWPKKIVEFGFGTGLNTLLSALYAEKLKQEVEYWSIEKFPLTPAETLQLNFADAISQAGHFAKPLAHEVFQKITHAEWERMENISTYFQLKKTADDFVDVQLAENYFDVCYFDAFSIRVQRELWEFHIFEKIHKMLKKDGLFTTYACNATLKKNLAHCGFEIEKIKGPSGRREMTIAWKK